MSVKKVAGSSYINHFTQPDTLIPDPTSPQAFNRYSYANNNPVNYTDPSGHVAIGDSNEAGCSGRGPACIIDMYGGYGDDDGMMDSLRNYVDSHKDYDPVSDLNLSDEEKALVSIAMFQNAVQETYADPNTSWSDILTKVVPIGVSVTLLGIITEGASPSPDDNGGGSGGFGIDVRFGSHHSEQQWINDMSERGWTYQQIEEAVKYGESVPSYNSVNKGNSATRYIHPDTGRSVVVDDVTHEILHVGGDGYLYSPR